MSRESSHGEIAFLGSLGFGLDVVGLYYLYGGVFLDGLESCMKEKNTLFCVLEDRMRFDSQGMLGSAYMLFYTLPLSQLNLTLPMKVF